MNRTLAFAVGLLAVLALAVVAAMVGVTREKVAARLSLFTRARHRTAPGATPPAAATPDPAPDDTAWLMPALKRMWALAWSAGLALLTIVVGELLPPMQALSRHIEAHRQSYLTAAIVAAASGYVLFMGCTLHLLFARGGPHRATVTFAEAVAAWRARAWRRSTEWRRFFLWAAGAAVMGVGIVGIPVVLGPPGVKFLLLVVFGYAAVRIAVGLWRAGRPGARLGPGAVR